MDTNRSSLGEGPKSIEAGPFELKADEPLRLRVFVDKSVVEVFANGRQAVMRRVYPVRTDSVGIAIFSRGGPASHEGPRMGHHAQQPLLKGGPCWNLFILASAGARDCISGGGRQGLAFGASSTPATHMRIADAVPSIVGSLET